MHVFVGYAPDHADGVYDFYDYATGRHRVSRDVIFDERNVTPSSAHSYIINEGMRTLPDWAPDVNPFSDSADVDTPVVPSSPGDPSPPLPPPIVTHSSGSKPTSPPPKQGGALRNSRIYNTPSYVSYIRSYMLVYTMAYVRTYVTTRVRTYEDRTYVQGCGTAVQGYRRGYRPYLLQEKIKLEGVLHFILKYFYWFKNYFFCSTSM